MTRVEHIGDATLYLGDCRDVLPMLGKVDAVVTDPPYGHDYASNYGASWHGSTIANDADTAARDEVIAWAAGRPCIVFGSWKRPRPPATRQVLIWDKGPAFGMGDLSFPWKNSFEEIYVLGDGFTGSRDEAVIRGSVLVSWESKGRVHPNEKPEWLLRYLVGKTAAGAVCDPFMGAGTTGMACAPLGRRFIGVEIEPKYFDIACRRIEQAQRQGDLLRDIAPPSKPVQLSLAPATCGAPHCPEVCVEGYCARRDSAGSYDAACRAMAQRREAAE